MTRFAKPVLTTIFAMAFVSPAMAGSVNFSYDKTQSTQANYAAFEKIAFDYCRKEARRAGYRPTENSRWVEKTCRKDMVEAAVKATGRKSLIQLHAEILNPAVKQTRLAKR